MTKRQLNLCDGLKRLGFTQDTQIKLYGEKFDLVSDPVVVGNRLAFVDAIEHKSGQLRRVRIPLNIVNMADAEFSAG